MSISYDSDRLLLSDIITKATKNAVYLIPDLQRPYVWTPRQVILLVDSIFRGWPFGSLLIWKVEAGCYSGNDEGIPHRPFWQVVDKVVEEEGTVNSPMGRPSDYFMVLDGQQRIQSLLLALGGDTWGFKLYDYEWSIDLRDRRMRSGEHWSKAELCLDINSFFVQLDSKKNKVRKIEVQNILEWAITDRENGQSAIRKPTNYEHPLRIAFNEPGRYIRLARLWDLAEKGLSESDYQDKLREFLPQQMVSNDRIEKLLKPLSEFLKIMETVKCNSFVHVLQVESFKTTPQWSKDDYDDAIVNIFTRLNTAGRELKREEITLAWLKIGWDKTKTNQKLAGDCLKELQSLLADNDVNADINDVVKFVSFTWAVIWNNGSLLEDKDLLKGNVIKPMASLLSEDWLRFQSSVESGSLFVSKRNLKDNLGSFNALIVALAMYDLADRWMARQHTLTERIKDSYQKNIDNIFNVFIDRWVFCSQWANVWASNAPQNLRSFAVKLHEGWKSLLKCNSSDAAIGILKITADNLIASVVEQAISYVQIIQAKDRNKVYLYRSILWIWHRLEQRRWKMSSVQMRIGRKAPQWDVDHMVADAYWKRLVDKEIKVIVDSGGGAPTDNEEVVVPNGFETKTEALEFINRLGNCSLLEKNFNISKSDKPMWEFMKDVHEFKKIIISRDEWEEGMSMPQILTDPSGASLQEIKKAIEERDQSIRKEVILFIKGKVIRKDLME